MIEQKKTRKRISSRNLKVHSSYKIRAYDKLIPDTGELEPRAYADYNTEQFYLAQKKDKNNIRKKALESFVRINRNATEGLENNEKLVYYLLTERITWDNNFVRNSDGTLSSILQLSSDSKHKDNLGLGRKHLNQMLESLQAKGRIKIVDSGNVKVIYLYSRYVWFGFEKNRNDKALEDISINQVVR